MYQKTSQTGEGSEPRQQTNVASTSSSASSQENSSFFQNDFASNSTNTTPGDNTGTDPQSNSGGEDSGAQRERQGLEARQSQVDGQRRPQARQKFIHYTRPLTLYPAESYARFNAAVYAHQMANPVLNAGGAQGHPMQQNMMHAPASVHAQQTTMAPVYAQQTMMAPVYLQQTMMHAPASVYPQQTMMAPVHPSQRTMMPPQALYYPSQQPSVAQTQYNLPPPPPTYGGYVPAPQTTSAAPYYAPPMQSALAPAAAMNPPVAVPPPQRQSAAAEASSVRNGKRKAVDNDEAPQKNKKQARISPDDHPDMIRVMDGDRIMYWCTLPQCPPRFIKASSVHNHVNSKTHTGRDDLYPCELCGGFYARKDTFDRHLEQGTCERTQKRSRQVSEATPAARVPWATSTFVPRPPVPAPAGASTHHGPAAISSVPQEIAPLPRTFSFAPPAVSIGPAMRSVAQEIPPTQNFSPVQFLAQAPRPEPTSATRQVPLLPVIAGDISFFPASQSSVQVAPEPTSVTRQEPLLPVIAGDISFFPASQSSVQAAPEPTSATRQAPLLPVIAGDMSFFPASQSSVQAAPEPCSAPQPAPVEDEDEDEDDPDLFGSPVTSTSLSLPSVLAPVVDVDNLAPSVAACNDHASFDFLAASFED
ncbi:hypothetical protein DFH29DRAFT_1072946 [Suillus ampliporus]|nr:hypothetical protein DFH29DRAFT_1072946 [Suillus ampliporus]